MQAVHGDFEIRFCFYRPATLTTPLNLIVANANGNGVNTLEGSNSIADERGLTLAKFPRKLRAWQRNQRVNVGLAVLCQPTARTE
jgi:hypothetical protein